MSHTRRRLWWVFALCLLGVTILLVAYALAEHLWLGGLDPEVQNTLHVIRGLAAVAVAATLATLVLLRRPKDAAPGSLPTPSARRWTVRLQHVSLRTKIVVPMVALAVVPAVTIGLVTISRMRTSLRERVLARVGFETVSKARTLQGFLQSLHRDLRFLSQINEIRDLAAADAAGQTAAIAGLRRHAERELLVYAQGRRGYREIRYLNSTAHELVRVNFVNGVPHVVPAARLQSAIDRAELASAFALPPGQIAVYAVGPEATDGQPAAPAERVLRCATPVEPGTRARRGLLVVHVDADYLFSLVGVLPPGTEAWLVNEQGMYLGYVGDSPEKRDRYAMARQRSLAADFSPAQASAILHPPDSVGTLETTHALLSVAPVQPDAQAADRRWTLLVASPLAPIEAPSQRMTSLVWSIIALVVAVAVLTGVLVAHYVSRPVAMLRGATRKLAAGNLTERVAVTTGDEIEELATDFNTMTDRLREAHERLSAWNVELEREVARQTDSLQRLQAGLARADKLASIGQMTASVMHEIGNPLAALKTKIQVTQEGGELCPRCQTLAGELLSEVDRLAAFLRSVSRLGRLRDPAFGEVALEELIRGVVALVRPELRRRRVSLRVESARDVPRIRGDADQLRQLLINFILNAAEASPDGGAILVRAHRLDSGSGPAASGARIEIVDHGVGIAADVLQRVWEPFFTTKPEGTGLGLAIARQIVQDHGGSVEIRSDLGKGTVVVLAFPRRPADATGAERLG